MSVEHPTYQPDYSYPTNDEKRRLHQQASSGEAPRVICSWSANPRIVVLDPDLNPEDYTYHDMLHDPKVPPIIQSRFQEYWNTTIARTCDMVEELPEVWNLSVEYHNVYDAAYFGAPVEYPDGQVPATRHAFLGLDDVDEFMERDIHHPLENPYVKRQMAFREEIIEAAADFTYLGRKGRVQPFTLGFDGPLTAAYMIFGTDVLTLMATEPEKARDLLMFITEACVIRNQALLKLAGKPTVSENGGLADDAVQLISTPMYEEIVLPAHEFWYSQMSKTTPTSGSRAIHCCGDGTRHFKTMVEKVNITSFDTGFPVDHGALRDELGPDVHLSGGPPVPMFKNGTPQQLFEETRRILTSGVKEGRNFRLREGNNLPPQVPLENLRAVYQGCLEYGWF